MNIEQLRDFCINKKGVTESFPFDKNILVFKVMNKIFLLTDLNTWEKGEASINVKCNPEKAIELRTQYQSILPGYHMSKKHWNTIKLSTREISDDLLKKFINHSYELVINGLTKKLKTKLALL